MSAICGLWRIHECWFIPKYCTRKIMWLLVNICMQKLEWLQFSTCIYHHLSPLPVPTYKWQPRPRLAKILTGELMDKNTTAENLFTVNWSLLSFYIFNFSYSSSAPTEGNIKIPLSFKAAVSFCFFLGFRQGKLCNKGFIDGCYWSSCRLLQQSEGENKSVSNLTCFQELHFRCVWVVIACFVLFNSGCN